MALLNCQDTNPPMTTASPKRYCLRRDPPQQCFDLHQIVAPQRPEAAGDQVALEAREEEVEMRSWQAARPADAATRRLVATPSFAALRVSEAEMGEPVLARDSRTTPETSIPVRQTIYRIRGESAWLISPWAS